MKMGMAVLAFVFFLPATLLASEVVYVDQPKKCFQNLNKYPMCALSAVSKAELKFDSHRLFVEKDTSLIFHYGQSVEILSGEVFIRSAGAAPLSLKLLKDNVQLVSGDVLLRKESLEKALEILNLNAHLKFSGDFLAQQALPPGYQNWFAPGRMQPGFGVPRVYEAEMNFRRVTSLGQVPTQEMVSLLKEYAGLRGAAQMAAAESYQGLVRRHYASVEEDREKERLRVEAARREQEALRRLYRARVLEGEYTQPFD